MAEVVVVVVVVEVPTVVAVFWHDIDKTIMHTASKIDAIIFRLMFIPLSL